MQQKEVSDLDLTQSQGAQGQVKLHMNPENTFSQQD